MLAARRASFVEMDTLARTARCHVGSAAGKGGGTSVFRVLFAQAVGQSIYVLLRGAVGAALFIWHGDICQLHGMHRVLRFRVIVLLLGVLGVSREDGTPSTRASGSYAPATAADRTRKARQNSR